MDAYAEAVKRFYAIYLPLKKKYSLRSHTNISLYDDGIIEIWEYDRETKKERICKVKESDAVELYNRAASWLQLYEQQRSR